MKFSLPVVILVFVLLVIIVILTAMIVNSALKRQPMSWSGAAQQELPKPYITFDMITGTPLEWNSRDAIRSAVNKHVGQRKLLCTEIRFLTQNVSALSPKPTLVVYAGAAPGFKNAFLASLFPTARFILVDPQPFDIVPVANIRVAPIAATHEPNFGQYTDATADKWIRESMTQLRGLTAICTINDYFTDVMAHAIARAMTSDLGDSFAGLLFVSDIRSETDDIAILYNNVQQYMWIRVMNPARSMLKFRLPFYNPKQEEIFAAKSATEPYASVFAAAKLAGFDVAADYAAHSFTVPSGTIDLQPWTKPTSAETRLVVTGAGDTTMKICAKNYEQMLVRHNTNRAMRQFSVADRGNVFDNCWDCAVESMMWRDYCAATGCAASIQQMAAKTCEYVAPRRALGIPCGLKAAKKGGDERHQIVYTSWSAGPESFRRQVADEAMRVFREPVHEPVETFDQIPRSMKYISGSKSSSFAIHIGQRKLFVSELRFLTRHAVSGPTLVVYVGSAPGNKNAFLASLFPAAKFLLVDPNPFAIVPCKGVKVRAAESADPREIIAEVLAGDAQITTVNALFTDEFADAIGSAGVAEPVLFISDIRTNINCDGNAGPQAEDEYPDDADIIVNSAQQFLWIQAIRPAQSMLKFRLPYGHDVAKLRDAIDKHPVRDAVERCKTDFGLDFVANYARDTFYYYPGTVDLQAWAGTTSTETRLCIDGVPEDLHDFGTVSEYEDRLFWYNRIMRNFAAFRNANTDKALGFDHCNDCAIENHAWTQYIKATGSATSVREYVATLTNKYLTPSGRPRGLIAGFHGTFFKVPRTAADLARAAAK